MGFIFVYYITISNGLLKDGHQKKMGACVWEFMWLLDKMTSCDENGVGKVLGGKPIKAREIADDLEIHETTVKKNLSKLKKEGYIKTLRTPYGVIITVLKAKKVFQKREVAKTPHQEPQMSENATSIRSSDIATNKEDNTVLDKTSNDKTITLTRIQALVHSFYGLKGWKYESTPAQQKLFSRHTPSAKLLLELCDQDLEEAKRCLTKVAEWANSKELDWGIETVFKRWYDLDSLKLKEKKPYYDNCRIFQKTEGGRWYIIRGGEIKELGLWPKKEEIIYK